MSDIVFILINGITVACIYGLVAVAVSITWSALGLLNLSYGFIFSFAGYGAWLAQRYWWENPTFVLFMGIIAGIIGGIIVCLLIFIPVHDKPNFTLRGMIGTLAVSLIGGQILLQYFGPRAKLLPEFFGYSKIKILDKLDKRISDVDLVILCTPMSEYESIIPYLNKFLDKKSIITDVGSTKQNVLRLKNKKLNKSLDWILSHPISGSEVSGPKFGNKNLFKNKWCIIINDKNKKKVKKVVRFWKKLGSNVIFMDPIEHDKIFAITSHLPHLIAYNLIKTAQDFQKKQKKNIIKFSAGGLRDFSRTAASNEIMWRDVFFNNKGNMINTINMFIKNLKVFKKNIKNSEDKNLRRVLIRSKKARKQIIQLKQDISKPDFGREEI